jgi:chorismate synthase
VDSKCTSWFREPVFDKPCRACKAMLSINAVKGFEYGSGFVELK